MNFQMQMELQQWLAEIRPIPLDASLSDGAMDALSRIYIALYNFVAGDGTEDGYESSQEYATALDSLCDLSRTRCERLRTASTVTTLYRLLRGPMRPTDGACIAECHRWIAEIIAAGEQNAWNEIPVHEALDRMELLYAVSDSELDPERECTLERLVGLAGAQLLPELADKTDLSVADCRALAQLYDLTMWGVGAPDPQTVDTIVDLARRLPEASRTSSENSLPPLSLSSSEARLWCLAILTDHACRILSSALETEYFACA